MKFKVKYIEEVEATSRQEAINMLLSRNNLNNKAQLTAEPLCPIGKEMGMCYAFCPYQENHMCNLDFDF